MGRVNIAAAHSHDVCLVNNEIVVPETNEANKTNVVSSRAVDVNAHPTNDRIRKTNVVGLIGLERIIVPCTDFTRPNLAIFLLLNYLLFILLIKKKSYQ